ncbi:MAG: hypothetical protein JWN04_5870 [Myxococcaceae bacterium]|nr:hypothetical protein [Myxococcaceae bacterium]
MKAELLSLDPSSYRRHALHDENRAWVETNCYVDLWIEVLHAHGFDPTAALAFTVAVDFEGDQWLFFKQPTGDMFELFGLDVQELNIFRSVLEHAVEQVSRGRIVLVELDAWHLPDTAGVSYHLGHTKTTVGIQSIDVDARKLGYFHNAGYFELSGDDFAGLFGLDRPRRDDELVPYTEFAKFDPRGRVNDDELLARSLRQLRRHLARRPSDNPVPRFRERFLQDLVRLREQPTEAFHTYAFATLRQCGAAFELAASYLDWLTARGVSDLATAKAAFETLSSQAKTVQFKTARSVMLKRDVDFAPMFEAMTAAWATAFSELDRIFQP